MKQTIIYMKHVPTFVIILLVIPVISIKLPYEARIQDAGRSTR